MYTKNTGYNIGGTLFATTRSIFTIISSKFISNYAYQDSAITALKTSSIYSFLIKNCLFTTNKANSNLISVK